MNRISYISEAIVQVKRPWGEDHPAVRVNPAAVMRNKIVSFVGQQENKRCEATKLRQFLADLANDQEILRCPSDKWLYNNSHLLKKILVNGEIFYRFTRAGANLERLLNPPTEPESPVDNSVEPAL